MDKFPVGTAFPSQPTSTLARVHVVDERLPGAEIVARGLDDLRRGHESVEALLVSMAATRLRQLGYAVTDPIPQPEERLWQRLARDDPDSAHSRYNALVRRLVSFQRAAACVA